MARVRTRTKNNSWQGLKATRDEEMVQNELDSAESAQDDAGWTQLTDSILSHADNLNTAQAMRDASNDRSRTEQQTLRATDLSQRDALVEKLKGEQSVLNSPTGSQNRSQSTLKVESTIMQNQNQNAPTLTSATQNAHSCDTPGCIAHNTREVEVGTDTFQFRVHFTPVIKKKQTLTAFENILDHATESVSRKVAQGIRKSRDEKKGDGFPSGRIVDIDSNCNFARTLEDEKNDILAMSQEQREKYLAELMRRIEMAKSLQSV